MGFNSAFKGLNRYHLSTVRCVRVRASLNDGNTLWNGVVRQFRRCANVYLHKHRQYSIAYYTPGCMVYSLLLLGYKPVQRVTKLNTVGNCNKMVNITILYYNIVILWDHRRIYGPSLTEKSLCGTYVYITCFFKNAKTALPWYGGYVRAFWSNLLPPSLGCVEMEAADSSETSVHIYDATRIHTTENKLHNS